MTGSEAMELLQSAIWLVLVMSAPVVVCAMLVGIVIAFFQALTQIQEMTLSFVPKIIVTMLALILSAPFIGNAIMIFAENSYARIERSGP